MTISKKASASEAKISDHLKEQMDQQSLESLVQYLRQRIEGLNEEYESFSFENVSGQIEVSSLMHWEAEGSKIPGFQVEVSNVCLSGDVPGSKICLRPAGGGYGPRGGYELNDTFYSMTVHGFDGRVFHLDKTEWMKHNHRIPIDPAEIKGIVLNIKPAKADVGAKNND